MKALHCLVFLILSLAVHAQTARQLPPLRAENVGMSTTSIHAVIPTKSSGPAARTANLPMKTGGASTASTTTNGNASTAQKSIVPLKAGGQYASASSFSNTDTAHKSTVPIKTADSKAPATASVTPPATVSKTGSALATPITPSAISAKDAAELNKQATQIKPPTAP